MRPPFCERLSNPAVFVKVYFPSKSHRQAATFLFPSYTCMAGRLHAAADLPSEKSNAWYSLDMQGGLRAGFDKMAERNISEEKNLSAMRRRLYW